MFARNTRGEALIKLWWIEKKKEPNAAHLVPGLAGQWMNFIRVVCDVCVCFMSRHRQSSFPRVRVRCRQAYMLFYCGKKPSTMDNHLSAPSLNKYKTIYRANIIRGKIKLNLSHFCFIWRASVFVCV